MKKVRTILLGIAFAFVIVFNTLSFLKSQESNTNLLEQNLIAVSNAESSFVQCNRPPNWACYFVNSNTLLTGVRIR